MDKISIIIPVYNAERYIHTNKNPQDAQFFTDVELMNMTKTYFTQCMKGGHFRKQKFIEEEG